jgi:hypothetical protein
VKTYNEKVAPTIAETAALRESVLKFKEPVTAVFEKMPGYLKKFVADSHQRFLRATGVLEAFVQGKEAAIAPLTVDTNVHMKAIDEWLTSYTKAKNDWDERERRNQEAFEEAERKRKAEELKRAEEEQKKTDTELSAVNGLYARFKEAYESRNDSLVVSFLSNSWQAGDGMGISAMQANLRRTFRVFDEIKYNIQGLTINRQPDGLYKVTYEVTITSRIYKKNIKHEEKSNVSDEVIIDQAGKAKINRTLSGGFWILP